MQSVDIEWDLLVLNESARPLFNLLYEANQVKAALEVKLSGDLGMAISTTRRTFEIASTAGVKCCYASFCDRRKAAATIEKLGFPCFNLSWSHGPNKPREDSGQWLLLVVFLRG